jgi:cytochrome c556
MLKARVMRYVSSLILVLVAGAVAAHEEMNLPPGPIKDRHELMEGIGANSKKIGDALKASDKAAIVAPAEAISTDAKKIATLFPPGSTNPQSRAKPEIWQNFGRFEAIADALSTHAQDVAKAARDGGDAGAAAKIMFGDCKACHDAFRVPEKE